MYGVCLYVCYRNTGWAIKPVPPCFIVNIDAILWSGCMKFDVFLRHYIVNAATQVFLSNSVAPPSENQDRGIMQLILDTRTTVEKMKSFLSVVAHARHFEIVRSYVSDGLP